MIGRRHFLSAVAAAVAGSTLDPERLLWQPGRKLISVPSTRIRGGYIALFDLLGQEITAPSYRRQPLTWDRIFGSSGKGNELVVFPVANEAWGFISSAGIVDAPNGKLRGPFPVYPLSAPFIDAGVHKLNLHVVTGA